MTQIENQICTLTPADVDYRTKENESSDQRGLMMVAYRSARVQSSVYEAEGRQSDLKRRKKNMA